MFKLSFGKININNDFIIQTNAYSFNNLDFLLFFDSRASNSNSVLPGFGERIASICKQRKLTYLMLIRPFENTVFFSLINFVLENKISAKTLITNLGFVDCTPKKFGIVEDIILQGNYYFNDLNFDVVPLEQYTLLDGQTVLLYSLKMTDFVNRLSQFLIDNFKCTFLIKTLELREDSTFQRMRPKCFYAQLRVTNQFLKEIESKSCVNLLQPQPMVPENYLQITYDGVHFVENEHKNIAEYLQNKLWSN